MTTAVEAPPAARAAFRIERQGNLAIVWFDLPGEKVNKFSSSVMMEFASIVDELARSTDIEKVVIASGKSVFIAGADVAEFSRPSTPEEAAQYVRLGQQTFEKLRKLKQTTVAAINGACMGGGCELAIS